MSVFTDAVDVINKWGWIQGELYQPQEQDEQNTVGYKSGVCALGAFWWAKHPELATEDMLDAEMGAIVAENGIEFHLLDVIARQRLREAVLNDDQIMKRDNFDTWFDETFGEGEAIWTYNDDYATKEDIISMLVECDQRLLEVESALISTGLV